MSVKSEPYSGDEPCMHGRRLAPRHDECSLDSERIVQDDTGDHLVLCGKHWQRLLLANRFRRVGEKRLSLEVS